MTDETQNSPSPTPETTPMSQNAPGQRPPVSFAASAPGGDTAGGRRESTETQVTHAEGPSGRNAPVPATPGVADPSMVPPVGVRVRTVVLGLLLALLALSVGVANVTEVDVDGVTVAICALIGAGVLLLGGAVASLRRERRRR